MQSNKFNFTERSLENLPIPTGKQAEYYDSGSRDGLSVIVTYGGTKTYYAYMKFQGRPKRIRIGRVGQIKLHKAREIAHSFKEQATLGIDPSAKRRDSLKDLSLKQFYETVYKPEYSLIHKKQGSINNDDSIFNFRLKDFQNRKLLSITTAEIEKLHNQTRKELTPYTANRVLSLIKHIYVLAIKHGYVRREANPAEFIKKFPEQSRNRYLKPDELQRFFAALDNEPNQVFKNYILISLYSGIRRNNVLSMRWSDVDLKNGLIYLPETKSGDPMHIPMSEQLKSLLETMRSTAETEWVIPSNKSVSGHLEDPKRPWQDLLKRANIQNLRLHDLRRTIGSYQAIAGSSLNTIGASLGHKSTSATQVYARLSDEAVRESMQKATDKMMEFVE